MGRFRFFVLCSVLAALALCFTVEARLGCKSSLECLNPEMASEEYGNEKLSENFKGLKPLDGENRGDLFGSGLRWVPSGPDPLHHNGSPKKPQTP